VRRDVPQQKEAIRSLALIVDVLNDGANPIDVCVGKTVMNWKAQTFRG
jgi:hypothetical protein